MSNRDKVGETVPLIDLKKDEVGVVQAIVNEGAPEIKRRLLDLGFVNGTEIVIENISPLKNPIAYRIKGSVIALRNSDAEKIMIKKVGK